MMLPTIETFAKPAPGVAIIWPDGSGPTFLVPFPGQSLVGAFATSEGSIVFVGSRSSRGGSGHPGATLLARFERRSGRIVRRGEIDGLRTRGALASRDGRTVFVSSHEGFAAIDAELLRVERRIELMRFDGDEGSTSSGDERDGLGPRIYEKNSKRWGPEFAGWQTVMIQFGFQIGETADGRLVHVDRWTTPTAQNPELREHRYHVVDWRRNVVQRRVLKSQVAPTALDRVDPGADLVHVTHRRTALFRASPPVDATRAGAYACSDPAEHAVVLHQWSLLDQGAAPRTIAVRTAKPEIWAAAFERSGHRMPQGMPGEPMELLSLHSPEAEIGAPVFWNSAAKALLPDVYEDPRDGLVWLSFADDHIRSLDEAGELGPLIILGGRPNVPSDSPYVSRRCPRLTFQGENLVVVYAYGQGWPEKMARYALRASDMAGRTGPITLLPAKAGPLPGSYTKAFAAYVREQCRDRFTLPDWSRDSIAAALEAQRATITASLPALVDPEENKLTFAYKVAGKPVKETAFFRRIVKGALPVVPELRALLLAYAEALGANGEGVQPWQDPDEGVGGLGPALLALALLDPDSLDVLRAYLETRDGEHEGFCLDIVVPAFFKCHGWRDAEAVRFGIYATLNRFWGGRRPPEGFAGMRDAMARLLTPEQAAEALLQEAEHFGRKPDWGHDAAAYREAFRSLLDTANPFEAAVCNTVREATEGLRVC